MINQSKKVNSIRKIFKKYILKYPQLIKRLRRLEIQRKDPQSSQVSNELFKDQDSYNLLKNLKKKIGNKQGYRYVFEIVSKFASQESKEEFKKIIQNLAFDQEEYLNPMKNKKIHKIKRLKQFLKKGLSKTFFDSYKKESLKILRALKIPLSVKQFTCQKLKKMISDNQKPFNNKWQFILQKWIFKSPTSKMQIQGAISQIRNMLKQNTIKSQPSCRTYLFKMQNSKAIIFHVSYISLNDKWILVSQNQSICMHSSGNFESNQKSRKFKQIIKIAEIWENVLKTQNLNELKQYLNERILIGEYFEDQIKFIACQQQNIIEPFTNLQVRNKLNELKLPFYSSCFIEMYVKFNSLLDEIFSSCEQFQRNQTFFSYKEECIYFAIVQYAQNFHYKNDYGMDEKMMVLEGQYDQVALENQ